MMVHAYQARYTCRLAGLHAAGRDKKERRKRATVKIEKRFLIESVINILLNVDDSLNAIYLMIYNKSIILFKKSLHASHFSSITHSCKNYETLPIY